MSASGGTPITSDDLFLELRALRHAIAANTAAVLRQSVLTEAVIRNTVSMLRERGARDAKGRAVVDAVALAELVQNLLRTVGASV